MSAPAVPDADLLYRVRHSAAHVMAQAVLEIYPEAKVAIGPPIENGFYYDFDLGRDADGKVKSFSGEDLEAIEERMRRIIAEGHAFHYKAVSADEARDLFKDQPYKLELIAGLASGGVDEYGQPTGEAPVISTYRQDRFEDLCRGPHVASTKEIPADGFKLLSVAGAYWRGSEKNPQLQRIYATAWLSAQELADHLHMLEEAKARDHRKLGRELSIFAFDDEIGPGLPLWLPNGAIMIEEIERLAKDEEEKAGYLRVRTPHLAKEALFLHSGHLPYYAASMYPPMEMEGLRYYVKPMNCPFHHKIFAAEQRSYRDLPLRLAEYGTCYRFEDSGALIGLQRVRSLQMNDAHIYCTEAQFEAEFIAVVEMYRRYFELFGIERYVMRLSKHSPEGLGKKYVDNRELWLKTEAMVRDVLTRGGVPFVEAEDEAAFYGPKVDVQIWSAIGREFTLATNQVDFAQPGRFDLVYTDEHNQEVTPLCIHRAPLATHERLIGYLIEHYAGRFPVWLAPEQARVIPIADRHFEAAAALTARLKAAGIRAKADLSSERMNAKIRAAQLLKVPYMLVLGDREIEADQVALRKRSGEQENGLAVAEFIARTRGLIAERSAEL
ncbi:MAG TPA: threonine--tRNA ligase [Anaerolineae bacterium]|nr:threonine--tRNA ligase [Anaerolineae bacterium]